MNLGARAYRAVTDFVGGVVSIYSPVRACAYRHGREVYRTYAAGEATGPNKNWRPRNKSADAEIKRAQKYLLGRVRDLVQNSSYISGAINKIVNNAVRIGIRPQARIKLASGKLNKPVNDNLELLFSRWARRADISGLLTFWALQRLALRHDWIDGEILVHRLWDDSLPGIVPLRLELIECDHLDRRVDGMLPNGNIARQGIEFDPKTGRPVKYHILTQHPGDYLYLGENQESKPIPAEDIIHVFEKKRASQTRGVSRLAAILMEAFDLSEYKATERIGARVAAAFAVFVKTNFPEISMGGGIGLGGQPGQGGQLPSNNVSWDDVPDYIESGRIQKLPANADVSTASHNRPGNQYEPYVRDSVRSMSTETGMSYEAFSNDYTSASFSSARSASLEERISYQCQQQHLNENLNDRVWAWFLDAAYISGLAPNLPGYASDPLPYHEAVSWQNPGWAWVDPLKDSKAAGEKVERAMGSRRAIAQQQGENWHDVVEDLIEEEEVLSKLYELRRKNRAMAEGGGEGDDAGTTTNN